ncbi:biopolymer transporter ExbD [Leptolyngbya sp. BL0902]|uniref:ExbD/TolR family protein n=1 Tax=Leptolyngbya sp. BL0902 TaxID=1115757 RepID=UPI0018E81662|nr:biopolymer transporter ExbD [Leptolyngbya sp. BL0902]QQE66034.1 biopolymer transporter ExbD [Leptolyngbya sp. BL0902]
MRWPEEPESPPQINIVPMIDVVFAVLVFFLVSSLYLSRNEGLTVALPGAETGTAQPQLSIVVTVEASGTLAVGGQAVSDDQLLGVVQAQLPATVGNVVVIQADQAVPHGRVVAVMDQIRTLEGVQLAIATQPPSARPAPEAPNP